MLQDVFGGEVDAVLDGGVGKQVRLMLDVIVVVLDGDMEV